MPNKLKGLKQAIDSDEETSKAFKQLKFTEGVINGRIAVVEPEEETAKRTKAKKAANRAVLNAGRAEALAHKAEFKNFIQKVSKK